MAAPQENRQPAVPLGSPPVPPLPRCPVPRVGGPAAGVQGGGAGGRESDAPAVHVLRIHAAQSDQERGVVRLVQRLALGGL